MTGRLHPPQIPGGEPHSGQDRDSTSLHSNMTLLATSPSSNRLVMHVNAMRWREVLRMSPIHIMRVISLPRVITSHSPAVRERGGKERDRESTMEQGIRRNVRFTENSYIQPRSTKPGGNEEAGLRETWKESGGETGANAEIRTDIITDPPSDENVSGKDLSIVKRMLSISVVRDNSAHRYSIGSKRRGHEVALCKSPTSLAICGDGMVMILTDGDNSGLHAPWVVQDPHVGLH